MASAPAPARPAARKLTPAGRPRPAPATSVAGGPKGATVGWSLPANGDVPPVPTEGATGGSSAAASELVAHAHASAVSAVRSARVPAASWVAVPTSMPCARYPCSAVGTPAPAAVISTFASRGASGSMSLSRFVIICALASASAPYCGSAAIVRSAFSASPRGSHAALAIPKPPPSDETRGP